ncbi:MAG: hypothetical protein D6819_08305, partial [Gammaproteobacteria bacterium]
HYAGRYRESNQVLEVVYFHYASEEEKARISLTGLAEGAAKSTLSEAIGGAYHLAPYEKVYLHTMKALNYMMLGDPDGARVEVRRALHQHELIEDKLKEMQAEIEKEQRENAQALRNVSKEGMQRSREDFYREVGLTPQELALIRKVKNGYANAVTYNVSATVYELHREYDDAIIDLARAYELYSHPAIAMRLVRLVRLRSIGPSLKPIYRLARKEYPRVAKVAWRYPRRRDNVHVFLHTGDSPRIHALDIRFYNPVSDTLSKISIPRVRPIPDQDYKLLLRSGRRKGLSGVELDFDALALRSFHDKLPGIYMRAFIRLVVNTLADKKLKEEMGTWGQILAAIKNEALEQADTRSWTALPKRIYYASLYTRGKRAKVTVTDGQGMPLYSIDVPVKKGQMTLVNIRKMGGTFLAQQSFVPWR